MPRDFTCEPCTQQKETLEAMGFRHGETTLLAGSVTWTGHGIEFELHQGAPLSPFQAADLLIQTARECAQKKIRESIGLR